MTKEEKAFAAYFDTLELKYFKVEELLVLFRREKAGKVNGIPSKDLWPNIAEPLKLADKLREKIGKPCSIWSSYRSKHYNDHCGGSPRSRHLKFNALDLHFKGVSARRVYNVAMKMRENGDFKGGLGLYRRSGFIHIDTRGYNATWGR